MKLLLALCMVCTMLAPILARTISLDDIERAIDALKNEADKRDEDKDFGELFGKRDDDENFNSLFDKRDGDKIDDDGGLGDLVGGKREEHAGHEQLKSRSVDFPGGSIQIHLCFFCDSRCEAQIGSGGAQAFFTSVGAKIEGYLQSMDSRFSTEVTFTLLPGMVVEASWYTSGSNSVNEDLLAYINDQFWNANNLYSNSVAAGCNADFLVIASDDPVWSYISVDGIAPMMQMCLGGYSSVKLNSNVDQMATLTAHELGHLIGMYHDEGSVNSAYTGIASEFSSGGSLSSLSAQYSALESSCSGDSGCPSGNTKCIMNPSVNTQSKYSDCSIAYFNMYYGLSSIYPTYYNFECTAAKKRDVTREKEGESSEPIIPPDNRQALRQLQTNSKRYLV